MKKVNQTPANRPTNASEEKKKKSHPFWQWFWLTFLVVSLAYAWYSFYVPPNDVIWAENITSAQELARRSDKNMMLFFTGKWCVPCKIMKRTVFADQKVAKTMNAQIVPVLLDIDDPNVEALVKQYNIGTTPITIFTDANGEVLNYAVGKMEKTAFLEMLNGLDTKGMKVE